MLIGLALVMAEIFVPSGGIIGFLSFASIVAAIVMAFVEGGAAVGTGFLLVACVAVPVVLTMAFRFLPHTPMGKRLLPSIPTTAEVMPDSDERRLLRQLVGKHGLARSKMLPSGAVLIDGHTLDAMSEGQPIDAGQPVKVIEVRGNMMIVRLVDAAELTAEKKKQPADDVLSQPIESLGFDPFADPLV